MAFLPEPCSSAVASSTIRLGIYGDSNGSPGSLLVEAGAIDSSTTGFKELTISQTLAPGRYWIAAVAQGGTPTVDIITGMSPYVGKPSGASGHTTAYHITGVSGALPASFGTPADSNFACGSHCEQPNLGFSCGRGGGRLGGCRMV
jgi:hypothetical protein